MYNGDESPLSFCGIPDRRVVCPVGVEPEVLVGTIGGRCDEYRMATCLLTIPSNLERLDRCTPHIIFKGGGNVNDAPYDPRVTVSFQKCGVIDSKLCQEYYDNLAAKVDEFPPSLLLLDSATSHHPTTKPNLKLRTIPGRTTSYLQPLDVFFFHVFKLQYTAEYTKFQFAFPEKRLSASERRVLMTRWVARAYYSSIELLREKWRRCWVEIGILWDDVLDTSNIKIRGLSNYQYHPPIGPPPAELPPRLENSDYEALNRSKNRLMTDFFPVKKQKTRPS